MLVKLGIIEKWLVNAGETWDYIYRYILYYGGGFHRWGIPNIWMVYFNVKSNLEMDDNWGTHILGNLYISWAYNGIEWETFYGYVGICSNHLWICKVLYGVSWNIMGM